MIQKIKDIFHIIECFVADLVFNFPAKRITVIGVTGTDGKTTTSHLIYHILSEAGKKVSLISSIYADIGGNVTETGFHVTTPRPWSVRAYLKKAVDAGSEFFILETTSHALEQNRVWGINFSFSVLTNITHEHLYHHRSFDHYVDIKARLLLCSDKTLINKDAEIFEKLRKLLNSHQKSYLTYSVKSKADFMWTHDINSKLIGGYNKENIMAAYGICTMIGIDKKSILKGISTFNAPKGRFEVVYDENFRAIIDFAHTPNSIEKVLEAVKEDMNSKGRLIHVFGAASQRDDSKRSLMGEASGRFADIVILTEEDYRNEDIHQICTQIAKGLEKRMFKKIEQSQPIISKKVYAVFPDRTEAIRKAVSFAKEHDVVILTGKSHEKSLNRNGKEYPWDEFKALKDALHMKSYV